MKPVEPVKRYEVVADDNFYDMMTGRFVSETDKTIILDFFF